MTFSHRNFAFLVLLLLLVAPYLSARERPFEGCELALRLLVLKLEDRGEFDAKEPVTGFPSISDQFSDCFVMPNEHEAFKKYAYHVFRMNDDVTVYILRQPRDGRSWNIYGPFTSAYRK